MENENLNTEKADADDKVRELRRIFSDEIVEQACLLDVADLNINDDMARQIAEGIKQLKQNRQDINAQQRWIRQQAPGLQVLLCLWIMDMDLLGKIQGSRG